ncbi:MAG TPA: hypothetical protein VIO59_08465 [Rhodanobacter sp.]
MPVAHHDEKARDAGFFASVVVQRLGQRAQLTFGHLLQFVAVAAVVREVAPLVRRCLDIY